MRSRGIALVVCDLMVGCGGSTRSPDLSKWIGAPWIGTETSQSTCPNPTTGAELTGMVVSDEFAADGTAGFTATFDECDFSFTVSADTATLSNGPVICSETVGGVTVAAKFTSYTLTTSDGAHLMGTGEATAVDDGMTCQYSVTITATR
jgi:hypothetical protein